MDLDIEKKKAAQLQFLAERLHFLSTRCGPMEPDHYVTAMLPPPPPSQQQHMGGTSSCDYDDPYSCPQSQQYDYLVSSTTSSPSPPISDHHQLQQQHSVGPPDMVDLAWEQSLGFVCEEVVISRRRGNKLGLTLFYCVSNADSRLSDVFVGEIESGSPAAQTPGLRLGDQVLQIDHQDVFSRDQVMALFSAASGSECITLLLARSASSQLQLMAADIAAPHHSLQHDPYTTAAGPDDLHDCYDVLESVRPLDADSGMGRTAEDHVRTEDSSDCGSGSVQVAAAALSSRGGQPSGDDFIELDLGSIDEQLERLRVQCLQLERARAFKQQQQAAVASQPSINTNKPTPRMGTRLPPRGQPAPQQQQPPLTMTLLPPPPASEPTRNPVLRLQPPQTAPEPNRRASSSAASAATTAATTAGCSMQWVMKKRSDGSKYLVKRPVRVAQGTPGLGPPPPAASSSSSSGPTRPSDQSRTRQPAAEDSSDSENAATADNNASRWREYRASRRARIEHKQQSSSKNSSDPATDVRVMLTFV